MTRKRFYNLVHTDPLQDGFGIFLDGRPVRTRMGNVLCAPNRSIADEIVREWSAQTDEILPDTMPFTQILNTRIDRVAAGRKAMTEAILKYLDTDLICYPAPDPEELRDLQKKEWSRFTEWFAGAFGHPLSVTTALRAVAQPESVKNSVRNRVEALDDDTFTILQWVTAIAGSIVMALSFTEGAFGANDIVSARFVEEDYKERLYNADVHGRDPMLETVRRQMEIDLAAAQRYIAFLARA